MRKLFKVFGGLGGLGLLAGLAIGAYAFTNSITVNGGGASNTVQAGYGAQTADSLTADTIHFAVDTDPTKWDSVSFKLNDALASGGTLEVTYDGATYMTNAANGGCTSSDSGITWTCTPGGATPTPVLLSLVTAFNVTAAQ